MVEGAPGTPEGPVGAAGGPPRADDSLVAESIREQAEEMIARFAATSRRTTMVFDPSLAGLAARSVRAGGSLAEFVEALHRPDADGPIDDQDALASDGYEYTACATAQEAEAEMAAWHELLHGPDESGR